MANRRRSNPGRVVVVLFTITVVAIGGIFVVTSMRTPTQQVGAPSTTTTIDHTVPTTSTTAPPTTTTTVPLPFEEVGPLFQWERSLELGTDQAVLALLEHDGKTYLLTSTSRPETRAGMETWISEDGVGWTQGGTIEDRFEMVSAASSDFGLIAYGLDPAAGVGMTWRSTDGTTWEPSVVAPAPSGLRVGFDQAVAGDGLLILTGRWQGEADHGHGGVRARIQAALDADYGDEFVTFGWFYEESGDVTLTLFGPLHVPLRNVTPAEIGLSRADFESGSEVPSEDKAWVSQDGSTWRETTGMDWSYTDSLRRGPDGRLWVNNWVDGGAYATSDGVSWERAGDYSSQAVAVQSQSWGLMGYSDSPPGIAVSDDGNTWRTITVSGIIGHTPGIGWSARSWAGGAGGIAMIARPDTFTNQPSQPGEESLAVWTEGRFRIEMTEWEIKVYENASLVLSVARHSPSPAESAARYDPVGETITFLHPTTKADLITLDTAATNDLEDQLSAQSPETPWHLQAFLFSSAATWPVPNVLEPLHLPRNWTLQDLGPVTDGDITSLWIGADRVIMVAGVSDRTEVLVGLIPEAP